MKSYIYHVTLEMTTMDEYTQKVYSWALSPQAEAKENIYKEFYWTNDAKKLLMRLKNAKRGLFGVIGLQGIGKTSLCEALAYKLWEDDYPNLRIKWLGEKEVERIVFKQEDDVKFEFPKKYFENLNKLLQLLLKNDYTFWLGRLGLKQEEQNTILNGDYDKLQNFKRLISLWENEIVRRAKERRKGAWITLLGNRIIFVDLPDYDKNNRTRMNKDLAEIQKYWNDFQFAGDTTLVLFIQKELYGGHFFFGKMQTTDLKPLKPEEMIDSYKQIFGSTKPFTQDALLSLAQISRGIYRRFMKYIAACIEANEENGGNNEITKDLIEKTISLQQIYQDIELELMDLYPKSKESRILVLKVLEYLRVNGETLQEKLVTEIYDGNKMMASRTLRKMETYNYLEIKKVGLGNLVTLKLF